jgi:hypothetical protein
MTEAFQTSRADGRSDRVIAFALVSGAAPGTLVTHDQFLEALSVGLDEPIGLHRVYAAVRMAGRMLLRQEQRGLESVRGLGYRVLSASEHLPAALTRKDRAEFQIQRGMELLREVRWTELDGNQRKAHEGQLLIMSGLYQVIQVSEARHARQEQALDEIRRRLERLEGDDVGA